MFEGKKATKLLLGLTACALVGVTSTAEAAAQSWREITMSRKLEGAGPLRAEIAYGVGTFSLRGTDDDVLYRMALRYDEDKFEPVTEYTGERLRIALEGGTHRLFWGGSEDGGSMELELARGVPMDLDLDFGAVKANVDLGGLALTDLELSTGASESRIDISAPNPRQMGRAEFEVGAADFTVSNLGNLRAERTEVHAGVGKVVLGLEGAWPTEARLGIDMGVGALELRIPEGLGVRVRKESFLTSFDPEGLVKRGDSYYSLDWEEADRKLTINLNAAFGSVRVVWIQ
ncbi:MAG: toast rack family protein [Gemmatimonadota bacterium]|nr:toast rack family protein [Gemmatimonadota bacterium]